MVVVVVMVGGEGTDGDWVVFSSDEWWMDAIDGGDDSGGGWCVAARGG